MNDDLDTERDRHVAEMGSIRTFLTTVAAVADVHPHLRRITFAGGDLAAFSPLGPDTFLYLQQVITEALVAEVFGLRCRVVIDEVSRTPLVLPMGRHHNLAGEA